MGAPLNAARTSRNRSRRHQPMAEINVTPFVDVMLVLLIIFMVSAPLLTAGVPIEMAKSDAQPADSAPDGDPLTVTVASDGRVFINDSEIQLNGIGGELAEAARAGKQEVVYLRGDSNANYGALMQVMGKINAAGFKRIALISEAEKQN